MTNQASGSKTQLLHIDESTWGTTPTTAAMQATPFKTFNLKPVMETFESKQIYADRMSRGIAPGLVTAQADLTAEFVPDVYDAFMESVFCAAWATNVLNIGTTPKFFSIEEGHPDITAYRVGTGMVANKMGLTLKKGILELAFGFLGKGLTLGAATKSTSIVAAPTHLPINSLSAVITVGGSVAANITDLSLNVESPVELGTACNASSARGFSVGQATAKGDFTALVEDDALFTTFLAGAPVTLLVTVGTAGGGIYAFSLPGIVYSSHESPTDKEGMLTKKLAFTAGVTGGQLITVTRTPAP
jgi:hypothetical protein